jgi:hypothetical protein
MSDVFSFLKRNVQKFKDANFDVLLTRVSTVLNRKTLWDFKDMSVTEINMNKTKSIILTYLRAKEITLAKIFGML